MAMYVSGGCPLTPSEHRPQGAWVWVPPSPESNASSADLTSLYSTPISPMDDTWALDNTQASGPALLSPYPSPDLDMLPLDESLLMTGYGDLSLFPDLPSQPQADANAEYHPWLIPSVETPFGIFDDALDTILRAEVDLRISEMAWDDFTNLDQILPLTTLEPIQVVASPSTASSPPATPPGPSPAAGCLGPSQPSTAKPTKTVFACPETSCSRSFANLYQLKKHEHKHTRPFVCPVCVKGHAAKKDLHRHLWVRHAEFADRTGVPCEMRRCHVRGCGFEGRQDNLVRHVRTKHGR